MLVVVESGLKELARRVARLDQQSGNLSEPDAIVSSLEHFVRLTSIDFGAAEYGADGLYASPAAADEIVGGCRLISRLHEVVPQLTTGPLCSDKQYWIGAGRKPDLLSERFVDVSKAKRIAASSKPFNLGLFTSTGFQQVRGMWRVALEMSRSTLFPLPWHTWAVRPREDTRIREITTASDWAAFVCSNPSRHNEFIYPDWRAAAQSYDGIHLTLRAVTAIQGISLRTVHGVIAPAFWDVESTFWLRWCFPDPVLIEVMPR